MSFSQRFKYYLHTSYDDDTPEWTDPDSATQYIGLVSRAYQNALAASNLVSSPTRRRQALVITWNHILACVPARPWARMMITHLWPDDQPFDSKSAWRDQVTEIEHQLRENLHKSCAETLRFIEKSQA